jgi:hypothetical protein
MNQLDKEYEMTNQEYGMGDFIEELKDKGYIDDRIKLEKLKLHLKQSKAYANGPWKRSLGN